MPDFIPGIKLAGLFYEEVIKPLLDAEYPDLPYAAALIGSGSEILGFDTAISTDHHWGPRLLLFVSEADKQQYAGALYTLFREKLPPRFYGYPTGYNSPDNIGVRLFDHDTQAGQVEHRIDVQTVADLIAYHVPGVDLMQPVTPAQWLTFGEQHLLSITRGAVFHDAPGDLTRLREKLAYYPRDVWLYLLAAGWIRISQEEAFVGRTGDVGDDIGSRLIAARLVRDLMRLCFLMEKTYAPYPKWFGTGFARLTCAAELLPVFDEILKATDWRTRERHLAQAYSLVTGIHNRLNITEPLSAEVSLYHDRPYQVIHGDRFADALLAQIQDDEVRRMAQKTGIGSIDQFTDSTNMIEGQALRPILRQLYD